MANVILRPTPDGSQDELVEIELPHDVDVGHDFTRDGADWRIVGMVDAKDTPLRVRGTSAWLAVRRS